MLEALRKTVLGTALSAASRAQLASWLVANRTGGKRLRAGVPAGWRVGDKTGSGEHNTTNDVGVIWPPGRAPVIVAVYYTIIPDPRRRVTSGTRFWRRPGGSRRECGGPDSRPASTTSGRESMFRRRGSLHPC